MKALKARITNGVQRGTYLTACDNSGAKSLFVISFKTYKGVKERVPTGGVGALVTASVRKGNPEMRKKVVTAIIVRQKKDYRRIEGIRIKFEDNAAVVLKDDKGNPKGTLIKGPIAREAASRWPAVAKIAKSVI